MNTLSRRQFAQWAVIGAAVTALPLLASAQSPTPAAGASVKNRALFQVTDNDPARWNIILNNMRNLKEGMAPESVEIELVAYGPGVSMLKADSAVKQRIADAIKDGVKINACQNTMNAMKLTPSDMAPDVSYVPAGVVEVVRKQQQGWAYVRS